MSKFSRVGKLVVKTSKVSRSSKKELRVKDVLKRLDSAVNQEEFDSFINTVLTNAIQRGHKNFKVTVLIEGK